jgi:UDP-N-acetylglucosamine 4-epimerase
MIENQDLFVNGDGETSRDFCFIENAVQANILAATANEEGKNQIYNVALGDRTTLNELFSSLVTALNTNDVSYTKTAIYQDFRVGDVRHSQADISKAKKLIGYQPAYRIQQGINKAMPWYIKFLTKQAH